MWVVDQRLPPGMEHGEEAELRAQMLGIGGDDPKRLGDGPEEQPIDDRLVLQRDLRDRLREGKDDVEVLAVEEVRRAGLDPGGPGERLALGTVAIAAGVIPDPPMPAVVALFDMPAERGGATLFDRGHHPALGRREGGSGLGANASP